MKKLLSLFLLLTFLSVFPFAARAADMSAALQALVAAGVITNADAAKATTALNSTTTVVPAGQMQTQAQTEVHVPKQTTTPAKECYVFSKNFGISTKSDEVWKLKDVLIKEGYLSSRGTNEFGPNTANIVKKFQKKHGIDTTGYVGNMTRAKLNGLCSKTSPAPVATPTPTPVSTPTPTVSPSPSPQAYIPAPVTQPANVIEAVTPQGSVISPTSGTIVFTDNTLSVSFMPVPNVQTFVSLVDDDTGRATDLTNLLGYTYIPDSSVQHLTFKIPETAGLELNKLYRIEICARKCTKGGAFALMKSFTQYSMNPQYYAGTFRLGDPINVPLYVNATGTAPFAGASWKIFGNPPPGVTLQETSGASAVVSGRSYTSGTYSFKVQAKDRAISGGYAESTVVIEVRN